MKNFFVIMFLGFLLSTSSSFSSMNGQGPLKIQSDMLDILLNNYFNPKNRADRPTTFAITKTGDMLGYTVCPAQYAGDCILRVTEALKHCQQNVKKFLKRKERCWVFAKGRKIVWNNLNIEIPKGTPNQQIKEILIEQGFYGSKIIKKKKEKKQSKKKSTTSSSDITKQLKELKQLLDDGTINQEEFIKAKKKLLN